MRGEKLAEAYVGLSGVYGDAVRHQEFGQPHGFPVPDGAGAGGDDPLSPALRHPDEAASPQFAEAESISPG